MLPAASSAESHYEAEMARIVIDLDKIFREEIAEATYERRFRQVMSELRDPSTAPGVPEQRSSREEAIELARTILQGGRGDESRFQMLSLREARLLSAQLLRALGLS